MSFKSEAHRKKIIQLEKEGKIKKGTTEAWAKESKSQLPERVKGKTGKPAITSIGEIEKIRVKKFGK